MPGHPRYSHTATAGLHPQTNCKLCLHGAMHILRASEYIIDGNKNTSETFFLQVSGSKIWQMERSCMCCQESGEREASVTLFCPQAKSGERKFRKVNKNFTHHNKRITFYKTTLINCRPSLILWQLFSVYGLANLQIVI